MKLSRKVLPYCLTAVFLLLSINTHSAVSYVTSIDDSGTSSSGASLTVPSSVQEGDILIAHIVIGLGGTSNFTVPSGWNLIGALEQSNDVQQSLYYKLATVGEAGNTYTWGFSRIGIILGRPYVIGMSIFRGVDNTSPIADKSSWADEVPNNRKIDAPSVTTINANSYLFAAYAVDSGSDNFTPPSSMTERYDLAETSFFNIYGGITVMSATESFSAIGSTGDREARVENKYTNGIAQLVALNADVIPPEINDVITSCDNLSTLSIQFSEPLDETTAKNINNYSLVSAGLNSIAITQASVASNTVTLTLANDMSDLTPYTITVNNVEDFAGNKIISNSSSSLMLSCEVNCVTEDFSSSSLPSTWSVGNSSGTFGDPSIVDGRLQLTDSSQNVSTLATLLKKFPGADNRIEIEFNYYSYGGNFGADGIAVIFSDASVTPVAGGYGGSLGYAQRHTNPGFYKGWLGVGIDEFGNFSSASDGNKEGGPGKIQNAVAIRGSGSGTTGYPYLDGTSSLNPGVDDDYSLEPSPGHQYKIVIDHTSGGGVAKASVFRDTGSGYEEIIPEFNVFEKNPAQDDVPADWLLSFTGSTGSARNFHEIDNFKVCAAQPIENIVEGDGVDHYEISHSSPGLTCEGSKITITAHDANNDPTYVIDDTDIAITTTPSVNAIINSPVTMPAGSSSISVYLQQTTPLADINIDVIDENGITDNDGSSEDPHISFLDTAFRFYADGSNVDANPINTQISGKPTYESPLSQSLSLRAIRTNTDTGACEAGIAGSQTVSFAYTCIDPNNCSTAKLSVSADETKSISGTNNGSGLTYTDLDMVFDANGSAPFNFTFPDAGKIKLYANLNVPENVVGARPDPAFTLTGSSNEFVVRPFAFDLGLTGDYEATDSNGTKFVGAGTFFPMTIRAVNWEASDDIDNDGFVDDGKDVSDNSTTINFGQEISSPQALSITHTLKLPVGGNDGNLTSTEVNTSASEGFFTTGMTDGDPLVNVSWDEVGIIDLDVSLENYLSASGANVTGIKTNVGRFYPASFSLISSFLTNSCTPASGDSFSYMDQPSINISYVLRALNATGSITSNYDGSFAKATLSMVAENNNEGTDFSARLIGFDPTNWGNGDYIYSDTGSFNRLVSGTPNVLDGPYQDLKIGIQLADNDGDVSALTGLNMRADTSSDCGIVGDCEAIALADDLDVRFGKLKLNNVFGPETSDLDMTVQTEYFDGTRFVVNTDDSCTVLTLSNVGGDNEIFPASPPLTSNIISGEGTIRFDAAGLGNQGSSKYQQDTNSYLPWLNTENDNDGDYGDNPFGTVTFGQFRGNDRRLYWREIVR